MNKHNTKQTYLTSMSQISKNINNKFDNYIFDINENLKILESVIKEYNNSIKDIPVNTEHHYNLSNEMNYLVNNVKSQIASISRIKGCIKNTTKTNSERKGLFKLIDAINRIKLLTDDELRENFCKLAVDIRINSNIKIKGSATSLVQIILIHIINACHAYKKYPGDIELIVSKDPENNMIFEIHDSAFDSKNYHESHNESDIYMSYMLLKSEFNGNIWLESQDNGTSFYISIPNCF